jgi:hypothetical protein
MKKFENYFLKHLKILQMSGPLWELHVRKNMFVSDYTKILNLYTAEIRQEDYEW